MPIGEFHDCTWGSVRLWCARIDTDNSRTIVVHELADGDEHPTQDRGLAPRRVTCELLFVEMPRESTAPLERFLAFKSQVDDGEPLVFQHPLGEAYYARIEEFNYTLDEDGNLESCTATFIRAYDGDDPIPAGTGVSSSAGGSLLTARADEFAEDLEAVGISSSAGTDAVAYQDAWSESDEVPTRDVLVNTSEISGRLGSLIEDEGLEDDLELFAAYRSTIMLGAAMRAAALSALSETPKVTAVRVSRPVSLLALARSIYGGAEAEDRVRQILSLNSVRHPAWIEEGTVLMIPVPRVRTRLWAA